MAFECGNPQIHGIVPGRFGMLSSFQPFLQRPWQRIPMFWFTVEVHHMRNESMVFPLDQVIETLGFLKAFFRPTILEAH